LRVFAPDNLTGSAVIDGSPLNSGKSLPKLRMRPAAYAKRFSVPFEDRSGRARIT
jgi:hypothetical protein